MTNHTYTADDFRTAEFARHIDGRKAMRIGGDRGAFRWWVGKYGADSDEGMADGGWEPVVTGDDEKDELIHLLRGTVRDIRDKATTLLYANKALHEDVAAAKGAGVSLDTLRTAWEAAEVPTDNTPVRAGDEMITRIGGGYLIRKVDAELDGWVPGDAPTRVRKRAPQREPWADLDDAIASSGVADGISAEDLAVKLHEQGWRKTGGEES